MDVDDGIPTFWVPLKYICGVPIQIYIWNAPKMGIEVAWPRRRKRDRRFRMFAFHFSNEAANRAALFR